MSNYLGEYQITFDAKGRFLLPSGYKRQIEADNASFVISRGFENCLTLYTKQQWQKIEAVVVRLNEFSEKARRFKRKFLNGATPVEVDSAGRLLLSKSMLEHAGITKDAIFSTQLDKVEIWETAAFRKEVDMSPDEFSGLANEVLGSNFLNPLEGS